MAGFFFPFLFCCYLGSNGTTRISAVLLAPKKGTFFPWRPYIHFPKINRCAEKSFKQVRDRNINFDDKCGRSCHIFFSFLQRNGELWKIVTLTPPFPSTYILFSFESPAARSFFQHHFSHTQDPWAIFPDPIRSDFFSFQIFLTFRPQLKSKTPFDHEKREGGGHETKNAFFYWVKKTLLAAHTLHFRFVTI